ncbi:hypothetical protein [Zymomonas mobilis]|uniref:CHAD domain-containing protein n=1 Tax=Zymomonas mobilis subsp. pomaceae (strain ATCC 29192 / DSM 22645 / JCM 10191 / CCUG 17912 / NBRC 13757 / NCIMB 11200 / NRRL B-4491 / Barker I) TaxID=579138 RepID=F8ET21_ZYMMT|nr:hypothetical protein [Zymomonas mobilis]AEI37925.1 conserved hypothetical protein [Zymomonas mobilis subsp. pomaceae ATCC 29192]MDX5949294.1 hypothetical protein [Zymomonas mobilis subsp. pomaceae]GEB89699.1 hypothetical protein ZMO02_13360 [Zymomonas mobilis subsp. pomaceae]
MIYQKARKKSVFLASPCFTDLQLDRVFNNILLDDVPHMEAACPQETRPALRPEDSEDCYRLCWQLLEKGAHIASFRRLVGRIIARGGTDDPDERLDFKYVRAKFKHIRFACANLDERHRYPWSVNLATSLMGHMQDAFKNHQKTKTVLWGSLLWLVLLPPFYKIVQYQLSEFRPATKTSLLEYFRKQNGKIRAALNRQKVTGHQFHDIRKIISRRIAFNDTLRVIHPAEWNDQMSLYLATINGLMGDMHDVLVEKKIKGEQDYDKDTFPLPDNILTRLATLLALGENGF